MDSKDLYNLEARKAEIMDLARSNLEEHIVDDEELDEAAKAKRVSGKGGGIKIMMKSITSAQKLKTSKRSEGKRSRSAKKMARTKRKTTGNKGGKKKSRLQALRGKMKRARSKITDQFHKLTNKRK